MRENAHDKGRRYLTEGRLEIRAVTQRHISARCKGESGEVYVLSADAGGWSCSCPAYSTCSHLVALQLCTLKPLPLDGTGPNGPERNHR